MTALLLFSWADPQARATALLALALGVAAVVAWLLYRRLGSVPPRRELMSFGEHLEELRIRLLRVGLLLVLWTAIFLSVRVEPVQWGPLRLAYAVPSLYDNVAAQVYLWLVQSTVPPNVQIIVSTPTEAVGAQMEIALLLGLFVSLPALGYELWAFFAPGLERRERRFLARVLPVAVLLFAIGAAFGLAVVVPLLFQVLYGFAAPLGALPLLSAGHLVGTVATMAFLFGLAFELPLAMVALVRLGIVAPEAYTRKWRHATLTIFIVAALASDPTLTSQLIIGTLLLALYGGGIVASHLVHAPLRGPAEARPTKA